MEILNIFRKLHADGATIALVTHDRDVASVADRIVYLKDGKLTDHESAPEQQAV